MTGVNASLERALAGGMEECGWVVSVRKSSWPLFAVAEELVGLLQLRKSLDSETTAGFVGWVWTAEPPMSPPLRHALSVALHRLLTRHLPRGGRAVDQAGLAAAGATMLGAVGAAPKFFCTAGPETLPAGWLPLSPTAGRRPVVNDDVDKATMLTAEHGYQFAGMLNHPPPPAKPSSDVVAGAAAATGPGLAELLAEMDTVVLSAIGVGRLSQPRCAGTFSSLALLLLSRLLCCIGTVRPILIVPSLASLATVENRWGMC